MQAWFGVLDLFLFLHFTPAFSNSCRDSGTACKYYKQCKVYQDAREKLGFEKNHEMDWKFITIYKQSMVCDRENRFICCPVEDSYEDKLSSIENPTHLPQQEEEAPVTQVGLCVYKQIVADFPRYSEGIKLIKDSFHLLHW